MLGVLKGRRSVTFPLPAEASFADMPAPEANLDPALFTPGEPVVQVAEPKTFNGFVRPAGRGTGTRNFIVILAVTSESASYARALEGQCAQRWGKRPGGGCCGVVAVAHTEGGAGTGVRGDGEVIGVSSHRELLMRTLAGWLVRPSRIPSLCTRSTRAGIEWCCCHRAVCMARPR